MSIACWVSEKTTVSGAMSVLRARSHPASCKETTAPYITLRTGDISACLADAGTPWVGLAVLRSEERGIRHSGSDTGIVPGSLVLIDTRETTLLTGPDKPCLAFLAGRWKRRPSEQAVEAAFLKASE